MRRHAAMLLLAALMILGLGDNYLRYLSARLHPAAFTRSPQAFDPGYEQFLSEVDRIIPQGVSVGVVTGANAWPRYFYWYYRAWYRLAGRRIVPMYEPQGVARAARVFDADYIAFWKTSTDRPKDTWVLHSDRGTLVRNR
jgi:hypothetical protein